jgi:hypothetical protein
MECSPGKLRVAEKGKNLVKNGIDNADRIAQTI